MDHEESWADTRDVNALGHVGCVPHCRTASWVFALAAITSVGDARSEPQDARDGRADAPPAESSLPPPPKPLDREAADRLLEKLRGASFSPEVIPPASSLLPRPPKPKKPLWPEGAEVVNRSGALDQEGGWWVFRWSDPSDEVSVKLLPNLVLEQMLRAADFGRETKVFTVSGEMTVFQEQNYLLVGFAAQTEPGQPRKNLPPSISAAPDSDVSEVGDVVRTLQIQAPPLQTLPSLPAGAESASRREPIHWATLADGTPLVDRPARLVQSGQWWTVVFESDHPGKPEPPLRLLPNQVMEGMVKLSERGASGLVFVVSGDVTAYRGENYVLTRMAVRRSEMGNLSK